MSELITSELFATLNILVLERLDNHCFKQIGIIPDWVHSFLTDVAPIYSQTSLEQIFPFLENFLFDAEIFWAQNDRGILKSGFWDETNLQGQDYELEASAVCLNQRKILLIELADTAYREKQALIQVGRESQLSYERLVKEIQKKEILLHCIFHDLAGQITTFTYCLELLGLENLSDKGRERLAIGQRQVKQQHALIREILLAFSTEMQDIQEIATEPEQAPDLLLCVKNVVSAFLPTFSLQDKQLYLHPEIDPTQNWKVIGEQSRIERVLSNLVENAFRYTPIGSTVTIDLQQEDGFVLCTIDDQGSGVPSESVKYLFQRFFQGKEHSGKAGLGLHFCRITVERWGGTIGYSPLAGGGARFWFRLRQV